MDKQTLKTILICIGFYMVWANIISPRFFPPQEQPPQNEPAAVERTAEAERVMPPTEMTPAQPGEAPSLEEMEKEALPAVETAHMKNDLIHLRFTNRGAAIEEARLKKFSMVPGNDEESNRLPLLAPIKPSQRSLAMTIDSIPGLADRPYNRIDDGTDPGLLIYQTTFNGLEITRKFELKPGKYHADLTVGVRNVSAEEKRFSYWTTSAAGIVPEMPVWEWERRPAYDDIKPDNIAGAVAGVSGPNTRITIKTPAQVQDEPFVFDHRGVAWAGLKNSYFSAVLKPDQNVEIARGRMEPVGEKNISASLQTGSIELQPGESVEHKYMFFMGPNSREIRNDPVYGEFAELHKLPFPEPVTRLFTGLLHGLYGIVRNYGIAIIILTIVVRIALHPLTRKSQQSMHEMQKLGPKVKEMKEKFKDDKKKQQEEMMKLYREHGVNPMGGCLPILLQFPILIGLFGALRSSIYLRHAPFMAWIRDLSQPDNLMMLPDWVPLAGNGPLNILPLLLIIAMIAQQYFSPRSEDPQAEQTRKMMMWMMPALFGVLFYSMPSGLVLYFMTSTALGAAESKYIRSKLEHAASQPAAERKKPSKESWLDRAAKASTKAKASRGRKMK